VHGFTMDAASYNFRLEKGCWSVKHKYRKTGRFLSCLVIFVLMVFIRYSKSLRVSSIYILRV